MELVEAEGSRLLTSREVVEVEVEAEDMEETVEKEETAPKRFTLIPIPDRGQAAAERTTIQEEAEVEEVMEPTVGWAVAFPTLEPAIVVRVEQEVAVAMVETVETVVICHKAVATYHISRRLQEPAMDLEVADKALTPGLVAYLEAVVAEDMEKRQNVVQQYPDVPGCVS